MQACLFERRAESFPDLSDPILYPRLDTDKLAWLATKGERRSFDAGDVLYEQGERDAPFYVIERGRVDFVERKPGKEMWFAEADAGTFIGDIATFTGEPASADCVAAEPCDTIYFDRPCSARCWPARRSSPRSCWAPACSRAARGRRRPGTA